MHLFETPVAALFVNGNTADSCTQKKGRLRYHLAIVVVLSAVEARSISVMGSGRRLMDKA